jgi:hypothetical protein
MDYPDVEFAWTEKAPVDPEAHSTVKTRPSAAAVGIRGGSSPATERAAVGEAVPIPTLPIGVTRNRSLPRDWRSVGSLD